MGEGIIFIVFHFVSSFFLDVLYFVELASLSLILKNKK